MTCASCGREVVVTVVLDGVVHLCRQCYVPEKPAVRLQKGRKR